MAGPCSRLVLGIVRAAVLRGGPWRPAASSAPLSNGPPAPPGGTPAGGAQPARRRVDPGPRRSRRSAPFREALRTSKGFCAASQLPGAAPKAGGERGGMGVPAGPSPPPRLPVGGVQRLFGSPRAAVAAVPRAGQRRFPGLVLYRRSEPRDVAAGGDQPCAWRRGGRSAAKSHRSSHPASAERSVSALPADLLFLRRNCERRAARAAAAGAHGRAAAGRASCLAAPVFR